jgi:predicted nucleic acid-binding protein
MDLQKPRVVLDAMIWARGLIARYPAAPSATIVQAWKERRFRVLLSGELLDEIAETLLELGADRDDVVRSSGGGE